MDVLDEMGNVNSTTSLDVLCLGDLCFERSREAFAGMRELTEKSTFATLRPIMKTFENKTVHIMEVTRASAKPLSCVAEGEKLAKEITSAGGSALFVRTDFAREDDIVALVKKPWAPSADCKSPSTMLAPRVSSACSPRSGRSTINIRSATSTFAAYC
jgi:hypothetical protein